MKKWTSISYIIMCILLVTGIRVQAKSDNKALRIYVPLMNNSGFVSYDNESFSGYYIDYLEEVARYTGWNYELLPIETYDELDKVCESKEFDLMLGMIYSEEYDRQYFDYPKHTAGAKRYVFAVPKDSELIFDKECAYLRSTRIGIASNSGITELEERFRNFCFMNGINCVSDLEQEYENGVNFIHIEPSSWREKLKSGEIDGILSSDAFCLEQDMYAITEFGQDQIYFTAPNNKADILKQLDNAIEKINSYNSNFNNALYEKYFYKNSEHNLSFNDDEKEYLDEGHLFEVSVLSSYAPYTYINDDGKPSGMILEALNMISEKTGGRLKFKYRFYDNATQAMEAVQSGECDICGISVYSLMVDNSERERKSTSFYSDSFMYYKGGQNIGKKKNRTAVLMPELSRKLLGSKGETVKVVNGDTPGLCLKKVNDDEIGFTVLLSKVGDYNKSYNGYSNLNAYPVSGGEVLFCLSYSADFSDKGIAIIDKCIADIDEESLDSYITEVSMFEHKSHTLQDYVKENIVMFSLIFVFILMIICTLLIIIIISIMNNSRKIHRLLYSDEITGGASYKRFLEEAENLKTEPGKRRMLIYMNISSFKYINNVFGYEAGNKVLCEVENFMGKHLNGQPFARIYADRFAALICFDDFEYINQKIEEKLTEFEVICKEKYPAFNIWVKIGAYVLKDDDTIQKASNLANYAMNEIQKTTHNEYLLYDETMYNKVLVQKEIEKDMWGAIENNEFEAFYQPKYNIDTKELIGAEALVRWRHHDKGLLSPGVFIPLFEKNHFIIQVDFYIFECVCRFIRSLINEERELFPISSNFSRLHLNEADFVDRLTEIVEKYQVPPMYLEIEITETVATENFDQFISTIKQLKERGFKVSIDDFGSGHSSIQLLYKLPIDVLKFDKDFVDNKDVSEMELELMDSIITVTLKNGIKIICEGVETKEQEEFVRKHNCIYVQGYLYSRPVEEKEFRKLLKNSE